eukprot:2434952-Pyramimonas_sp.AAC.1
MGSWAGPELCWRRASRIRRAYQLINVTLTPKPDFGLPGRLDYNHRGLIATLMKLLDGKVRRKSNTPNPLGFMVFALCLVNNAQPMMWVCLDVEMFSGLNVKVLREIYR